MRSRLCMSGRWHERPLPEGGGGAQLFILFSFDGAVRHVRGKGAGMWYVAQVQAGRESSTLEMCRRLVPPSVMEDCFMPEYEVMWKIRGEWRLVKRLLFPGYLFFVTDDPEALNRELSRVPMPIRLLGNEENSFFPLTGKERDWFLSFMDGNHTVRMSEGYISGDKITVTRGPLMGFEGDIRKIDRHKRRAYIDVSLFGRTVPASVGLEIVRKSA